MRTQWKGLILKRTQWKRYQFWYFEHTVKDVFRNPSLKYRYLADQKAPPRLLAPHPFFRNPKFQNDPMNIACFYGVRMSPQLFITDRSSAMLLLLFEPPHDKTNKIARAPSEYSDQPGHPPSLIRVFAVPIKKAWVLSYPLSAQRRLWSDWADAKTDLNLRWAHGHFVGFVMRWLVYYHWRCLPTCLFEPQHDKTNQIDLDIWASSRENLSSGFPTRPAQLQHLGRGLKFRI